MKRLVVPAAGILAAGLLALLLSISGSERAAADRGSATVQYLIGTGLLAEFPPNVGMAHNGDSIEITGEGTLSIHPKSVTGGGSFVHRDPSGKVVASGTWAATEMLRYHSFGPADPSLGLPAGSEGGLATIRVEFRVGGTPVASGLLEVPCSLGESPPSIVDGVRLVVPGALNFNKIVSGATLFIRE